MRFKISLVFAFLAALILFYLFIKGYLFHSTLNPEDLKDKNIILISIDALRADHLGVYGYYRNTSPFIDEIAKESIVFEQAFSVSGYTLPSHTSLFTGLYPRTHKVGIKYIKGGQHIRTRLEKKYKTLAEYLSALGYHTLWAGPKLNEQLDPKNSEGRGFQTVLSKMVHLSHFFEWLDDNPDKKFFAFFHTEYAHDPYFEKSPHPYYKGDMEHYPVFATSDASDYKGSILDTHEKTLNQLKIRYPKRWRDVYNDYFEFRDFWWSFVNLEDSKDVQRLKDLYDDCILAVDYKIARLISVLKAKKLYKKTIIILISDHGEAFGEHGEFTHKTPHREVLHVPFILYIPEFGAKRIRSHVSLIDVYPTVLDLIGQSLPHKVEGKSLLPLIKGTKKKVHDYIFGSLSSQISVSDGRWKLIRTGKDKKDLYHVLKDPYEKKDVSDKYPKILRKLDQEIDAFLHNSDN